MYSNAAVVQAWFLDQQHPHFLGILKPRPRRTESESLGVGLNLLSLQALEVILVRDQV